jgi:FkbM family methyltransferase
VDIDAVLGRLSRSERTKRVVAGILRAYVRYVPCPWGKRELWARVIAPYFQWDAHDFVARTIFGARMQGNTSDLIQNYIYHFGVWEPGLTAWATNRLGPGDTVIDVGANIGYFSLLSSIAVGPTGRVVAIEASPRIFRLLTANIQLNRLSNVRCVNVAASDKKGTVELFRGSTANCGETTTRPDLGFELEGTVGAVPLSEILTAEECAAVRLVKVDVEGAEHSVVAGMRRLLLEGPRELEVVVEVDPRILESPGTRVQDLVREFRSAGFDAYVLENDYWAENHIAPRRFGDFRRLQESDPRSEAHLLFTRLSPPHGEH